MNRAFIYRGVVEGSGRRRANLMQWNGDLLAVDSNRQALASAGAQDQYASNQLLSLQYQRENLMRDTQGAQFCQQPRVLLQSLINNVRNQMAAYESEFPAGQSPQVRQCLYQLEVYMAFIEALPITDVNQNQNLYFALCGMLWSLLDRVDNDSDQSLAQAILLVLCEHRMHRDDSLQEYASFYNFYRDQLPEVTHEIVSSALSRRYGEVLNQLRLELKDRRYQSSCALEDLKCKAKNVMLEVDTYQRECEVYRRPFDVKFYTTVLSKTQQLAKDPANAALKSDYEHLMTQNKQGAASPKQMLAGAMLAFIGALTVAATFIAEAVSACTSSAVTFPLKVAGFGAMIAGFTMFSAGTAHGTTSTMRDFRREVDWFNPRETLSPEARREREEKFPLMVGMRR